MSDTDDQKPDETKHFLKNKKTDEEDEKEEEQQRTSANSFSRSSTPMLIEQKKPLSITSLPSLTQANDEQSCQTNMSSPDHHYRYVEKTTNASFAHVDEPYNGKLVLQSGRVKPLEIASSTTLLIEPPSQFQDFSNTYHQCFMLNEEPRTLDPSTFGVHDSSATFMYVQGDDEDRDHQGPTSDCYSMFRFDYSSSPTVIDLSSTIPSNLTSEASLAATGSELQAPLPPPLRPPPPPPPLLSKNQKSSIISSSDITATTSTAGNTFHGANDLVVGMNNFGKCIAVGSQRRQHHLHQHQPPSSLLLNNNNHQFPNSSPLLKKNSNNDRIQSWIARSNHQQYPSLVSPPLPLLNAAQYQLIRRLMSQQPPTPTQFNSKHQFSNHHHHHRHHCSSHHQHQSSNNNNNNNNGLSYSFMDIEQDPQILYNHQHRASSPLHQHRQQPPPPPSTPMMMMTNYGTMPQTNKRSAVSFFPSQLATFHDNHYGQYVASNSPSSVLSKATSNSTYDNNMFVSPSTGAMMPSLSSQPHHHHHHHHLISASGSAAPLQSPSSFPYQSFSEEIGKNFMSYSGGANLSIQHQQLINAKLSQSCYQQQSTNNQTSSASEADGQSFPYDKIGRCKKPNSTSSAQYVGGSSDRSSASTTNGHATIVEYNSASTPPISDSMKASNMAITTLSKPITNTMVSGGVNSQTTNTTTTAVSIPEEMIVLVEKQAKQEAQLRELKGYEAGAKYQPPIGTIDPASALANAALPVLLTASGTILPGAHKQSCSQWRMTLFVFYWIIWIVFLIGVVIIVAANARPQ